jgi:hypothetical protein
MRISILSCLLFLAFNATAQHCPFDGFSTVVIKVTGLPKNEKLPIFHLTEITAPHTDSCAFIPGRIDYVFKTADQLKKQMREDTMGIFNRYMKPGLEKGQDFVSGRQVVFLTQPGKDCMIETNGDYRYLPRKFEVTYYYKGQQQRIIVAEQKVYPLCKAHGSWKRIQPVIVHLQ